MKNNGQPKVLEGCSVLPAMVAPYPSRSPTGLRPKQRLSNSRKGPSAGRFAVLNAFVDGTLRTLRHSEVAVWLVLYRDEKHGLSRVSQKSIAERAGVSERTVGRVLQRLIAAGLVKVVRQGRLGQGASTYQVFPTAAVSTIGHSHCLLYTSPSPRDS